MKTKCSKGFIATVAGVLVVSGCLWYQRYRWDEIAYPRTMIYTGGIIDDIMTWRKAHGRPEMPPSRNTNPPPPYRTNQPPQRNSNQVLQNLGFRQGANELSDAEKIEMTNLFVTKLKPAAEK